MTCSLLINNDWFQLQNDLVRIRCHALATIFPMKSLSSFLASDSGSPFQVFVNDDTISSISTTKHYYNDRKSYSSFGSKQGIKRNVIEGYLMDVDADHIPTRGELSECTLDFATDVETTNYYISNANGYPVNQSISLSSYINASSNLLHSKHSSLHRLNESHITCTDIQDEINLEANSHSSDGGLHHVPRAQGDDEIIMLEAESILNAGGILSMILTPVMKTVVYPIINVVRMLYVYILVCIVVSTYADNYNRS